MHGFVTITSTGALMSNYANIIVLECRGCKCFCGYSSCIIVTITREILKNVTYGWEDPMYHQCGMLSLVLVQYEEPLEERPTSIVKTPSY